MDEIVMAAGSALVSAMATDAWTRARSGIVTWWRKVRSDEAAVIDGELVEVRRKVLAARGVGDAATEQALVGKWQLRLQDLLVAKPELANNLRQLLDEEITPALDASEQTRIRKMVMTATASRGGRVYQAGRNLHITER